MQQFGFTTRSAILVIFLWFFSVSNVHASFDAEIVFANQIIDEIKDLKTETKSVGIPQPHRGHLVSRLNVAKYFVKEGRKKLENNKPNKAKNPIKLNTNSGLPSITSRAISDCSIVRSAKGISVPLLQNCYAQMHAKYVDT